MENLKFIDFSLKNQGDIMHKWAKDLLPICRSITGNGVRQTLSYLNNILPDLKIFSIKSGTSVFDWTVPKEWNINEAYVVDPNGNKVIDFKDNNLHIVGYSYPIDSFIDLTELNLHLHSYPDQPTAIPYVTSYYNKNWGFCLPHNQRINLQEGLYKVFIDSEIKDGHLNYAELIIKSTEGKTEEVLLSTYICHPSMANNELSGPVVLTTLALWLLSLPKRKYNYRIVFIPETIGSLCYIQENIEILKSNVICGYNITCVGDERSYSYLPSRDGNTLSDRIAKCVLKWTDYNYKTYKWSDRGSDERQYCAPGIDLPIASLMRTKYGEYPEYHSSLDDLSNVVTPKGLQGGFDMLKNALLILENNSIPIYSVLGEPQLGKRGLYSNLSSKLNYNQPNLLLEILTWSDGNNDLIDISDKCDISFFELLPLIKILVDNKLISLNDY